VYIVYELYSGLYINYLSLCLYQYAIILLIILILTCVLCFVYVHHIDEDQMARTQLNEAWAKQKNGTDAMSIYQSSVIIDILYFLYIN